MRVSLSEFVLDANKYFDLAKDQNIIITEDGKSIAELVRFDRNSRQYDAEETAERVAAVERLFGTLPSDEDLEDIRMERILARRLRQ